MSRAGPAAALALKTQSRLSAADNDLATTAAAGQALNAAAAAAAAVAPAAAAAAARPAVCLSARSASGCEQRRATKPTACGISRRSDAEANALRASKTKDAVRLRGNALLVFNRAKKKLKKSAVDNAAGEPS